MGRCWKTTTGQLSLKRTSTSGLKVSQVSLRDSPSMTFINNPRAHTHAHTGSTMHMTGRYVDQWTNPLCTVQCTTSSTVRLVNTDLFLHIQKHCQPVFNRSVGLRTPFMKFPGLKFRSRKEVLSTTHRYFQYTLYKVLTAQNCGFRIGKITTPMHSSLAHKRTIYRVFFS